MRSTQELLHVKWRQNLKLSNPSFVFRKIFSQKIKIAKKFTNYGHTEICEINFGLQDNFLYIFFFNLNSKMNERFMIYEVDALANVI